MYLIDTNIFLEILLEQDQADKWVNFFERINQQNQICLVTSYTLHSIETILSKLDRLNILAAFLEDLIEHKNIRIFQTSIEDELAIVEDMPKLKLDFDDTLQYYVAKKFQATIVSYDKHFKKLNNIKLYTP